jgi:Flp pilus assembly protein TadB
LKYSLLLIVNSVLLAAFTILLAYTLASRISIKKALSLGLDRLNGDYRNRRLQREARKYTRTISVKLSLVERLELTLIDKSNIRQYIPFMNFYVLLLVSVLVFILTFPPVYRILYFVPSTAVICGMFSLVPAFLLDLLGRYNSEKIRRKLAEFISVLNRWCTVKEDIFYAFERSTESGIGEPLRTFIRDMCIQVRCGINPLEALDLLQMKVDNAQFKDFVINIKQNIKFRGDITKLLTNMEAQFYKLEEEYDRRKISTYKDRLLIFVLMFLVLIIGYFFLKFNPRVEQYYLATTEGKLLLAFFTLLFAGGVYFSFGITRFKH